MTYALWGAPHSLFTGKARSYLIKKGLPFRECFLSHPDFRARVVPAVGAAVVPVLETPEGELVQDSTEIIEVLEARHPDPPMAPKGGVQRVVAHLIDAYGTQAMTPVAMHYRWSYLAQQRAFLETEFGRIAYRGPDRAARRAAAARTMDQFAGFLPGLGVTSETIPAIEAAYAELLDALDAHFQLHPYILGGRPSVADFGLMAPLFAHLGRDPVPAGLMKGAAPNVFRWTERMNLAGDGDGEFFDTPAAWFTDDQIPASLEAVLAVLFRNWTAELLANHRRYAEWIADEPGLAAGAPVRLGAAHRVHPSLGPITYEWRGVQVSRRSTPMTLWHFDRAAEASRGLTGAAKARLDALMTRVGGTEAMALKPPRPLGRRGHALVVG